MENTENGKANSEIKVSKELAPLDKLIGKWEIEGWFKINPNKTVTGTESYQWISDGHFLQTNGVTITNIKGKEVDRYESVMLIGRSTNPNYFTGHIYDSSGKSAEWLYHVTGDIFNISNDSFRFTGTFNKDSTVINGFWETSNGNGGWDFWYDKKLVKQK